MGTVEQPRGHAFLGHEDVTADHPFHGFLDAHHPRQNQEEQASGVTPLVKTKPILLLAATRRMSMGRVMVIPTPTAAPLIAPITGLRQL